MSALQTAEGDGVWEALGGVESRTTATLVMRIRCMPAGMPGVLRLAWEFMPRSKLVASPATGRIWTFEVAGEGSASQAKEEASRVRELRKKLAVLNARLRVEKAPAALRAMVDPWDEPDASARLQQALKRRFDPNGVLKPGFFVAGI